MSLSLPTLKNSELTFTNMNEDTVALDVASINSSKKKIKNDYTKIINDWDQVSKDAKKILNDKGTKGDKITKIFKSLVKNADDRKKATKTKSSTLVSRIDKDVQAYSTAILGQKIKELEAKLAELMQKVNEQ